MRPRAARALDSGIGPVEHEASPTRDASHQRNGYHAETSGRGSSTVSPELRAKHKGSGAWHGDEEEDWGFEDDWKPAPFRPLHSARQHNIGSAGFGSGPRRDNKLWHQLWRLAKQHRRFVLKTGIGVLIIVMMFLGVLMTASAFQGDDDLETGRELPSGSAAAAAARGAGPQGTPSGSALDSSSHGSTAMVDLGAGLQGGDPRSAASRKDTQWQQQPQTRSAVEEPQWSVGTGERILELPVLGHLTDHAREAMSHRVNLDSTQDGSSTDAVPDDPHAAWLTAQKGTASLLTEGGRLPEAKTDADFAAGVDLAGDQDRAALRIADPGDVETVRTSMSVIKHGKDLDSSARIKPTSLRAKADFVKAHAERLRQRQQQLSDLGSFDAIQASDLEWSQQHQEQDDVFGDDTSDVSQRVAQERLTDSLLEQHKQGSGSEPGPRLEQDPDMDLQSQDPGAAQAKPTLTEQQPAAQVDPVLAAQPDLGQRRPVPLVTPNKQGFPRTWGRPLDPQAELDTDRSKPVINGLSFDQLVALNDESGSKSSGAQALPMSDALSAAAAADGSTADGTGVSIGDVAVADKQAANFGLGSVEDTLDDTQYDPGSDQGSFAAADPNATIGDFFAKQASDELLGDTAAQGKPANTARR
ncbi:hypothetical protein WJX72_008902 [[Myrmecia] bisecta]|uniref:Uncharacterized protein n=1 Tax=[Myrmecia] bisecta TaxID=41462 RepID=A0AAW1QS15_9CHLO